MCVSTHSLVQAPSAAATLVLVTRNSHLVWTMVAGPSMACSQTRCARQFCQGRDRHTNPIRANTYTGTTTVSAGTLNISGSSASTSGATVAIGATLELSGATNALSSTTNITNDGSLSVSGTAQSVGNISGAGSTTISGAGSSATPTLIAKDIDQMLLTINNGAYVRIAASGTSTSVVTSLTMGTTANLDISNNDVVVNNPTPVAAASSLSTVTARVNAGFAGGNGIVTNTFTTSLETVASH